MKSHILPIIILLATLSSSTLAQHAIGLRFGGGNVGAAELSYQVNTSEHNRLQIDAGVGHHNHYNSGGVGVAYEWQFPFSETPNFEWYVGPGMTFGAWRWDDGLTEETGGNLSVGAILGIDYQFKNSPFQISVDSRPMINLLNSYKNYNSNWGMALGIRYVL